MKSKVNDEEEITLESINKKLDLINNKIDEFQKNINDPKNFIISLFVALGFICIAVSITLGIQLVSQEEAILQSIRASCFVAGVGLLIIAMIWKLIGKKK